LNAKAIFLIELTILKCLLFSLLQLNNPTIVKVGKKCKYKDKEERESEREGEKEA
jgi:hypothetical protein